MDGTSSMRRRGAFTAGLLLMAAGSLGGAMVGCQAPAPDASADQPSTGALISDANHGMGTKGFAFLQPIATAAVKPTGKFEPRLAPEVRLEQLDANGNVTKTVATFDATHRVNGEKVRRNRNQQFYVARVHTNGLHLDPKLTYRVRVLTGGTSLGFADLDVVKNQSEANKVNRKAFVPVIQGKTLPVRFRIEKQAVDHDGDGVFDWLDNCPTVSNPPVRTSNDVPATDASAADGCNPDETACDPQEQDCDPATFTQPDADHDGLGDACDCPDGYVFQTTSCVDVDECATQQPCDPLTVCTNKPGSYSCGACPSGYSGTGSTACVDVDECAPHTASCNAQAMCTNTPGSYTCGPCPAGTSGDGHTCTPSGQGGLALTGVTLPADGASYRDGAVSLSFAMPDSGQYLSYRMKCAHVALDISTATADEQARWWDTQARAITLPATFTPPMNSVSLNFRVGEENDCVLRGVDAMGQLSPLTSSTKIQVPFRTHAFTPAVAGQSAGWDFAAVGDSDGDGTDDLVVGGQGSAFLVFGSRTGFTSSTPDIVFSGGSASLLGYQVAGLGDINGDGRDDFALGDPGFANDAGRVLIYYGRPGRDWPATIDLSSACNADVCIEDGEGGHTLGAAVERAGDFDGDGRPDIAIGAPNYPTETASVPQGRLLIVLGTAFEAGQTKSGTFFGVRVPVTSSSGPRGFSAIGDTNTIAMLGLAIAGLGAHDAHAGSDLAVTAFGAGNVTAKLLYLSGRAYSGGGGLQELSLADFGVRVANDTPNGTWLDEGKAQFFGAGIYALGNVIDLNGGAHADAGDLGLWSFGDNGFYVYPGDNDFTKPDRFLAASVRASNSFLGESVCTGRDRGDLDGDGLAELCAGGEADPSTGAAPGTGELWYSDAVAAAESVQPHSIQSDAASRIDPPAGTGAVLRTIEFAGDLNGDGKTDLVVGAPDVGGASGSFMILY
jgi:hypothetical protein